MTRLLVPAWRLFVLVAALDAGAALAQAPTGPRPPGQPKPPAQAQPAPDAGAAPRLRASVAMDPYVGVVADSTVTFIGHEFYNSFVSAWRDLDRIDRYSLQIVERPSARWGSLVWVEYRNQKLFNAFLSPGRRDYVRTAGQAAAQQVHRAVLDADIQRLLFRDPDLAREEF
jgi:curli production assembly/transport component CsgE